jgi:hypothetical protein
VQLKKIISGGQTGADRAALDVGLEYGVEVGGWVPHGRMAEDGRIADGYPGLVQTDTSDPTERTMRNVQTADATLIVSHGALTGGSRLTLEEARRQLKPALHVDLQILGFTSAVARVREWLATENPVVLNVAGPRASEDGDIYSDVATLLRASLSHSE